MSTYIARRLDRLEERLGVSDTLKIEAIFRYIVRPGPNGPVTDVQAAKLDDNGRVLYRGPGETLEDFENRIRECSPRDTGRMPRAILGMAEDFSDAEPVLNR